MFAPIADRRLHGLGLALAFCLVPVKAQTLGDLIEQAKNRRQQQVLQGASIKPPVDPKAKSAVPATRPLLWSLTGVDERHEAVLIYRTRAYTVASDDASPRRIGPWTVAAVGPSGVTLQLTLSPRSAPVVLMPAPVGASAFPYQSALPRLGNWGDALEDDPLPAALRNVLTDIASPPKPPNVVAPSTREAVNQ